jgi:hypothetical protein
MMATRPRGGHPRGSAPQYQVPPVLSCPGPIVERDPLVDPIGAVTPWRDRRTAGCPERRLGKTPADWGNRRNCNVRVADEVRATDCEPHRAPPRAPTARRGSRGLRRFAIRAVAANPFALTTTPSWPAQSGNRTRSGRANASSMTSPPATISRPSLSARDGDGPRLALRSFTKSFWVVKTRFAFLARSGEK